MSGYAPRAREDSVRPRRLGGASGRPLNFTVRFRMHQTPAFLLVALVTLGSTSLLAQTETAVYIRVSAESCLIGKLDVPCSDVAAKLRELGTPLDAHIHLSVDAHASYRAASAAIESLQGSGFKFKVGQVNVRAE